MQPQGPELRDVHVPTISWWPLAPGWWVLAGLVIVAIGLLLWAWRRGLRRRRYVDSVLADLRDARERHRDNADAAAFAASAHQLLRRVARTRDPQSVTLASDAWRAALAAMAPKRDVSRLATLGEAIYRPGMPVDVDAVAIDLDGWVRDVLTHPAARSRGRAHAPS